MGNGRYQSQYFNPTHPLETHQKRVVDIRTGQCTCLRYQDDDDEDDDSTPLDVLQDALLRSREEQQRPKRDAFGGRLQPSSDAK